MLTWLSPRAARGEKRPGTSRVVPERIERTAAGVRDRVDEGAGGVWRAIEDVEERPPVGFASFEPLEAESDDAPAVVVLRVVRAREAVGQEVVRPRGVVAKHEVLDHQLNRLVAAHLARVAPQAGVVHSDPAQIHVRHPHAERERGLVLALVPAEHVHGDLGAALEHRVGGVVQLVVRRLDRPATLLVELVPKRVEGLMAGVRLVAEHVDEQILLPVLVDVEVEPASEATGVLRASAVVNVADAGERIDPLARRQVEHAALGVATSVTQDLLSPIDHGVAGEAGGGKPCRDLSLELALVAETPESVVQLRPQATGLALRNRHVIDLEDALHELPIGAVLVAKNADHGARAAYESRRIGSRVTGRQVADALLDTREGVLDLLETRHRRLDVGV